MNAQTQNSFESFVNRVYKIEGENNASLPYKCALEIEYSVPFRIRHKLDYPEMYDSYFLDDSWRIPQCQNGLRIDSLHGKNMIFIFDIWSESDTVALEFVFDNKIVESIDFVLESEPIPISSHYDPIESIKKHSIRSIGEYNEYHKINHFSIGIRDSMNRVKKRLTGCINSTNINIEIDTLDINTLSAFVNDSTTWAARGYSKPSQYGVTSIFYGPSDSIEYIDSWEHVKIKDHSVQDLFIQDDTIYVLTTKGIQIIEKQKVIKDLTFIDHLEEKNVSIFHGLFRYMNKPAVIFNTSIYTRNNGHWKSIYKFSEKYKSKSTAIALSQDSIYFVADRKLWFTNLDSTYQVGEEIENILRITKGPNNSILYKQAYNEKCTHGGIYFIDIGSHYPLKREYISEYPSLLINDIFYMEKRNTIVATSYAGIYEFTLENWMKKRR